MSMPRKKSSKTGNIGIIKNFSIFTVITDAFTAGTGGITDAHYLNARQERGYKFKFFENLSTSPILNTNLSVKNLEHIRQIMKPTISELASLFRVSRQTIYNWQSGEEPTIENVTRIEELAKTADFLASKGLTSSLVLKRKIIGNCSLFDVIREGGNMHDSAKKLVNILQEEMIQRKRLDERLAGRKPQDQKNDDYGSPMLDERE